MAWLGFIAGIFGVLTACEADPPTQSDTLVVPWQFNIEFSIEEEADQDYTARARLYDIAQSYDITGNAGTIQLSEGDAVFADGIELDIETQTEILGTLRVDYSQSLPKTQDSYLFELRRPDNERIEGTIPIPERFDVAEIGDIDHRDLPVDLTWEPVIEGATVDISILPVTDDCLTVIGGGAGGVVQGLSDVGSYAFGDLNYHATDHDCTYELIFTRRAVSPVPGRWFKNDGELPANDLWAIGVHTVRERFVALQR